MGILYVGMRKISFFGGPIMPDDVYALRSLLLILEAGVLCRRIPLPDCQFSAFIYHASLERLSRQSNGYFAGDYLVYKPVMILDPIDKHFGTSVWDQRSNYCGRRYAL